MTSNKNNPLSYIMEILNISGQQLADILLVDRSLVSKWKNGSRPFNASISHFNNAILAFIKFNEQQNIQILERFFKQVIPTLDISAENWLNQALRMWLSGTLDCEAPIINKKNIKCLYSTYIDIYSGNSGIQNAFLALFDYALSLPPGQQLLFSDFTDIEWLLEDQHFKTLWQQKLLEILEKGHYISIIHNTGRTAKNLSGILFKWLPLYFYKNLTSHYYQQIDKNASAPSVYIIKGHYALMSMCSTNNEKDRYTAIYKDFFSISQMENIFHNRLTHSKELVSLYDYSSKNVKNFFNNISLYGEKKDDSYFFTPIPIFASMHSNTLLHVLKDNKVNESCINKIMDIHSFINNFFIQSVTKYNIRHFHDLYSLKRYSELVEIPSLELSTISNQKIMISKKHCHLHISNLIKLLEDNENYNVSLYSFDKLNFPRKISLWVKQNCFVYSYSHLEKKPHVLSYESMITTGFFSNFETIWNHIPIVNKDKTWVISQLKKLLI